jgi:hypothetical protein
LQASDRGGSDRPQSGDRSAGNLAIVAAVASVALALLHPAGQARSFAGFVVEEAKNQRMDMIVHGGFIFVFALQLICYGVLSRRLERGRLAARSAYVFFTLGVAWISLNLLFDGLIQPMVAVRYGAPDQVETGRSLFVLIGALGRYVMPIGLTFFALSVLAWGWALIEADVRTLGRIALGLGALLTALVAVGIAAGMPMAFMAVFFGMAVWGGLAAAALRRHA